MSEVRIYQLRCIKCRRTWLDTHRYSICNCGSSDLILEAEYCGGV